MGLKIHEVGGREFINGALELPDPQSTVWVCSQPKLQLQILHELREHDGIVVLEKPIALNREGFEKLRKSTNFRRNLLRFSRVWNYSEIWMQLMTLPLGKITRIDIKRGGPDHQTSIPFPMDWAPHDIYLLCEVLGKEFLNLKIKNGIFTDSVAKGLIEIPQQNLKVEYRFGLFHDGRIAEWVIRSESMGIVRLNFTNQEIQYEDGTKWMPLEVTDAITRMYLDLNNVNKEQIHLALDAQELFWKQAF